ncbi:hypothetical protein MRX96_023384 [Rhipicephalus microplus]
MHRYPTAFVLAYRSDAKITAPLPKCRAAGARKVCEPRASVPDSAHFIRYAPLSSWCILSLRRIVVGGGARPSRTPATTALWVACCADRGQSDRPPLTSGSDGAGLADAIPNLTNEMRAEEVAPVRARMLSCFCYGEAETRPAKVRR